MTVGDINSDKKGTGARFNDGKPDLSLIPLETLADEARVWMYGERKYKRHNWMKGMNWSIPLACALRHLAAWQAGEDIRLRERELRNERQRPQNNYIIVEP